MGRAETERRWNHISFYGRGPRTRPEAGTDHGRRAVAHTPRKRRGRLMEGFRGVKCEKGRRRSSIVRRKAKGEFTRSSHWACWACGEAGGGNKVAALLSGRAVRCTMAIRNMSTVRITIGHHRRTTAGSDWPAGDGMGWERVHVEQQKHAHEPGTISRSVHVRWPHKACRRLVPSFGCDEQGAGSASALDSAAAIGVIGWQSTVRS